MYKVVWNVLYKTKLWKKFIIITIFTYLEHSHGVDHCLFHLGRAHDIVVGQEVVTHGNQRVFGPALEPVHGTSRNQARELQWAGSEFLSNL